MFFLLLSCVAALRMQFYDNQPKCFLNDLPGKMLVAGLYDLKSLKRGNTEYNDPVGFHVDITDPNGEKVLSREYGQKGRFTYKTHVFGEYITCLSSNVSGILTVDLRFHHGEDALPQNEERKLSALELRAQRVLDNLIEIEMEQNDLRRREETYLKSIDGVHSLVLIAALVINSLLFGLFFLLTTHLKRFFRSKKLI